MEHFQWIVALTRIISAVFRKGGDVAFLVEELHSVFDPGGGYVKRGGKYVPSLVAEIGTVIEEHLIAIGLVTRDKPDEAQQRHIDELRRELGCEDGEFPAERGDLRAMQHQGGSHAGRVPDLSQLRRLQVRLITESRAGETVAGLGRPGRPATPNNGRRKGLRL